MRKGGFNNKIEETFAESNTEFSMKLINRENAMLVLDKKICWSKSVFNDVTKWNGCKSELKL